MNVLESALVVETARLGLSMLALSIVLALYRLIYGPKHADRVIALDLLSVLVVAMVALYAIFAGDAVYLDVVIAYALVAFLGTVAFARYIERWAVRGSRRDGNRSKGDNND